MSWRGASGEVASAGGSGEGDGLDFVFEGGCGAYSKWQAEIGPAPAGLTRRLEGGGGGRWLGGGRRVAAGR